VLEVLASAKKQKDKNERHTYWEGRNKITSTCRKHDRLYRKYPKLNKNKQTVEPISEFSKTKRYKI
jgi:hypothetical protein